MRIMKLNPFRMLNFKNRIFLGLVIGAAFASAILYAGYAAMKATSTNEYCESCHVHPHSTETWEQGDHFKTDSGVVVNCIDCHLPPEGIEFLVEKAKAGARDVYGYYFKDPSEYDWEGKSTLEQAVHFTFEDSCLRCHQQLFQVGLSEEGVDAHLHYRKNKEELRCINCHLKSGHFHEEPDEQILTLEEPEAIEEIEWSPLVTEIPPGELADYTDVIPATNVKFEMVAVEGGTFVMGSSPDYPGFQPDEGPRRNVEVSPFWIGKFEVSWREFDSYYAETVTREKNEQGQLAGDATTGPTPPYGSPDQGWGKGLRPAITMTHYAATKYCEWLTQVTGRTYRLPTEAEWEYAARAGTEGPYFFETSGQESFFESLQRKLFGPVVNEEVLSEYAWYQGNASYKTHPARTTKPNPWGIHNTLGNVKEFCLDFYDPEVLSTYPEDRAVVDPTGPPAGDEHVVRGGSFRSPPLELRVSDRDYTRTAQWMKTDPQTPKSVWWYSDTNEVGFRIVRPFEEGED